MFGHSLDWLELPCFGWAGCDWVVVVPPDDELPVAAVAIAAPPPATTAVARAAMQTRSRPLMCFTSFA
jgi:hypothetical protein